MTARCTCPLAAEPDTKCIPSCVKNGRLAEEYERDLQRIAFSATSFEEAQELAMEALHGGGFIEIGADGDEA